MFDWIFSMRIRTLEFRNFGPFKKSDLKFVEEDPALLHLIGKKNEGKSNILWQSKGVRATLLIGKQLSS